MAKGLKLLSFSMEIRDFLRKYRQLGITTMAMKGEVTMKKLFLVLSILVFCSTLWAQQKYALVIGNSNYTALGRLRNPVNDAEDVTVALNDLGFSVDMVLDGDLDTMENAVMRLKNRLSVSRNSYGFLFYAGHGVQSNGMNYLIPIGANIPSENFLRTRAVSVQTVLDELNDASNELNVVVLDACRDNPFAWGRTGNRGLTVIANQPADSIVVYATSAGSVAQDGEGRNGVFTSKLLNNLKTPGLEVKEIFNRTGADVIIASDRKQIPEVYNKFFGNAYFSRPVVAQTPTPQTAIVPSPPPVTPQPVMPPSVPSETQQTEDVQAIQLTEVPEIVIAPSKPIPQPLPAQTNSVVVKPVGYGFMNLALGLGSYLQGDITGGAIVTGGYVASIALIAWELNLTRADAMAGYVGPVGVVAGVGTLVFGFVKPFIFNRNRLASANGDFDIAIVSSGQKRSAFALTYTRRL
jgi:uncharacterized membrane protein (DUF485 family)